MQRSPRHPKSTFQEATTGYTIISKLTRTRINGSEELELRPQAAQLSGVRRPLQRYDELLDALGERLGRLQLVDDALHVGLAARVAVEQGRPLVRRYAQPGLRRYLDDLGVVLAAQRLVRPELLLELHQRGVAFALRHLLRERVHSFFFCINRVGCVRIMKMNVE